MIQMTRSSDRAKPILEAALQFTLVDDEIPDPEGKPTLIKKIEVSFTGYGMFKIIQMAPDSGRPLGKIYTGRSDNRINAVNEALVQLSVGAKQPEIEQDILAFLLEYLGPIEGNN